MPYKPALAELLGTFVLTLVAAATVVGMPAYSPAYVAPVVVAVFVYSIGWISGAHLNPAVTIALASVRKIGFADAVYYMLAQMLGALGAIAACWLLFETLPDTGHDDSIRVAVSEGIGAFLLVWSISAVVERKVHAAASGIVIGMGLFVGIMLASQLGSLAILNPAVAFGIGSLSPAYLVGPIAGAVLGAWAYRLLAETAGSAPSETA